jgi:hypothetical protein
MCHLTDVRWCWVTEVTVVTVCGAPLYIPSFLSLSIRSRECTVTTVTTVTRWVLTCGYAGDGQI